RLPARHELSAGALPAARAGVRCARLRARRAGAALPAGCRGRCRPRPRGGGRGDRATDRRAAGAARRMTRGFESFIDRAPWPERVALRALLAVERRPRGARLLARAPLLSQALGATLALGRYDEPRLAACLGWDAAKVVARGRALRRAEGRP